MPTASPDELVRELRSGLAGRKFDVAEEVVVLEDGVAIELVTLESLLACQDGQQILRGRDHPRVLRGCPDG